MSFSFCHVPEELLVELVDPLLPELFKSAAESVDSSDVEGVSVAPPSLVGVIASSGCLFESFVFSSILLILMAFSYHRKASAYRSEVV